MRRAYRLPNVLIALCLWAAAARAADVPPPATDTDEKLVAEIVEKLSSPDFAVREAAATRLKEMGPEYIPALQLHRDHPDAEVAARVGAVIQSFEWMRDGAIVNSVDRGSKAEKLGLRPGDVVVKINDVDITGHLDLAKLDDVPGEQTMYVWRAGKVRTIKRPHGKIGYLASNWALDKGGNDHSRGVAALTAKDPDYAEAYRRLRKAREDGMSDPFALEQLCGLAARALDRDYANDCYRFFRQIARYDCSLTHRPTSLDIGGLPFDAPHTTFLLERYRNDAWSAKLYHELEDWATRNGRNYPWAKELVDKRWPDRDAPNFLAYDDLARIRVFAYQRRWDDALAAYANRAPSTDAYFRQRAHHAFGAAMRGGKVGPAVDIAAEWLDELLDKALSSGSPRDAAKAFWALGLAAAAGDRAAVERVTQKLELLNPQQLGELSQENGAYALYHPALAGWIIAFVEKRPEVRKLGAWEQIYLGQLGTDPATTFERFDNAIDRLDATTALARIKASEKVIDSGVRDVQIVWASLTGLMRFGQYERAREISAAMNKGRQGLTGAADRRIASVAAFAQKHEKELAESWKDLRGLIDVLTVRGTTWALRWDGHVFRVGEAGEVREFPGLPPSPAPLTVAFAHLRVSGRNLACRFPYGRRRVDYLADPIIDVPHVLDDNAGRWLAADAHEGEMEIGGRPEELVDALAMREVSKHHKPEATRPPRQFQRWQTAGRWFEDNLFAWVDTATGRAVDCGADIERRANLGRSVEVYQPQFADEHKEKIVLFTDAGAWTLDTKTLAISRIKLGLGDENVVTCSLPSQIYPKPKGAVLIGTLPQAGGQIVRVDATTFGSQPTNGFCGLGPLDWFSAAGTSAYDETYQDAVHRFYSLHNPPR
jgi:hypothetical protein